MSVDSYNMIPLKTAALMECMGNIDRLQSCWLSCIAMPGSVVWHLDGGPMEDQLRYVMGSKEYGVIVLRCQVVVQEGRKFVQLRQPDTGGIRVENMCISSLAGWRGALTESLPPVAVGGDGIMIEITSAGKPLVEASAWEAMQSKP